MAKRQARTIRHPSSKTLIQRQTQREMVSRPSGQVLDKPITTSVPAIKAARANAVPPPSGNWYTKDDAVKVGEYLAGTRELSFNELQRYDLNRDGKVTAADGMFVRQYLTDKVVRGPSGYSPIDANLIALHMVGAITIPPELIGRYDANGDGKITIDDARFIAQAIARPPVSESSPPKGKLPPELEWYRKTDGTWGTRLKIQLSNNKGKTGTSTAVKQRKTTVEIADVIPPKPTRKLADNETYVWDEKLKDWLVMAKQGTTPKPPSIAPRPQYPDFDPRPPMPTTTPKAGYVWAKAGYFVLDINPDTGSPYMGGRRGPFEPIPEYKWMQVPARFADVSADGTLEYDNIKWWKIANTGTLTSIVESSPPKGMLPPEMEWYVKADGTWGTRLKIQLSNNKGKTGTSTAVKQRKTTGVTPIGTNSQATVTTSQAKPKAKAKRKATAKAKRSTPKVSSVWL